MIFSNVKRLPFYLWVVIAGILGCLISNGTAVETPSANPAPTITDPKPFTFVLLEYDGGSWKFLRRLMDQQILYYIPNYIRWVNSEKLISMSPNVEIIRLSDKTLFDHPMLYVAGHLTFTFTDEDRKILKTYLDKGGFLFIEDYGLAPPGSSLEDQGSFAEKIQEVLKTLYPNGKMDLLPKSHAIFKTPYTMPRNKPTVIPENYDPDRDDLVPLSGVPTSTGGHRVYLKGFFHEGRMIAFFKDEGKATGGMIRPDPNGDKSYKLITNIISFGMSH
jgi:hypothetical protein